MPLDFPSSPTNGQYYNGYVYNLANDTWDSAYNPTAPLTGLQQVVTFTTSGTFSKASYPWLRSMRVRVQAGGGGGGGTPTGPGPGQICVAGAGGGGAYAESFITDIAGLAASVTVTVGSGGAGGIGGTNGADGGASSFGTLVSANGGNYGSAGGTNYSYFEKRPGAAPQATGVGNLVIPGRGSEGADNSGKDGVGTGPKGGDSQLGAGGTAAFGYATKAGNAAVGYGGGGSGSITGVYSGAQNGGAGSAGIVIVELYS